MITPRRAHKVDQNQSEIVAALRDAGAVVFVSSAVGGGFPDLVVLFRGVITLLEVKFGKYATLTMDEQRFFTEFSGGPVYVVRDVDEALKACGIT